MALGRKQTSDHEAWLRTYERIRARPNHALAQELVQEAAQRVAQRVRGVGRVAYGWSGGKDSQGLRPVMEEAGVTRSVLVISGLEYPAFLAWTTDNMPWGLTVELREKLTLPWLAENPDMLFPQDAQTASKWFRLIQHSGQRAYARREGLDMLILGRRRADGNYLGKRGAFGPEYQDREGFTRFSPISDWTHEHLLHVIVSYGMALPPCYSWPRGFRVGTGAWPARQWTGTREQGWREVLQIDRTVVQEAARHRIPGAEEALCAA